MKTQLNTSISANGCDFLSKLLNDAEHEQGVVQRFDELLSTPRFLTAFHHF